MAHIRVIHDPIGETLTVYWDDPEHAYTSNQAPLRTNWGSCSRRPGPDGLLVYLSRSSHVIPSGLAIDRHGPGDLTPALTGRGG